LFAPLRCERENRDRNDDDGKDDGYSKHLRLPFVWAKKPGSGARSRERYNATYTRSPAAHRSM
jgi:hypothetical protein